MFRFLRKKKKSGREGISNEEVLDILSRAADYLKDNPKVVFDPYPIYDERVMCVFGTLSEDLNYMADYERLKDVEIETMDIRQIATMYTFVQRGERFCDGHIAAYIENGTLYRLVKRQLELTESREGER